MTTSSTISSKGVIYSVPSRLIGTILKVHVHDDRLECYAQGDLVVSLRRLRKNKKPVHLVDYRHVVGNLLRKPQAFRNYVYREDLFPNDSFKRAWNTLDKQLEPREACREFVKILYETSRFENEQIVSNYLEKCMGMDKLPSSNDVKKLFCNTKTAAPNLKQPQSDPAEYNALFSSFGGVQ